MTIRNASFAFGFKWAVALSATWLAVTASASCSSGNSGDAAAACRALSGRCGGACTVANETFDCQPGTHCGPIGQCTAECVAGEVPCQGGQSCGANGQCGGGSDGGGNGSAGGPGRGGQTSGDGCATIDVPFGGVTPTVLLLVDRSGSMDEAFGNGTRWSVLYDALMNRNNGVVFSLQSQVRFGLSLYTGGDPCPNLVEVPIALDNYRPINTRYSASGPGGDTPTAESITAATATLSAFNEPGPKYILLVTDGLPDNCQDPDAHNAQSQAGSVRAARAAHAAGITLIPMGLSDEIARQGAGPGHLQALANAGAGTTNAPYYVASDDPAELSAQFGTIIGGIRTCLFDLGATIDPAQAGQGTVTLDGDPLAYDDPNGWRLATPEQVEIVGQACDRILSSADQLSIVFPCNSSAVIIR